jgi:L-aminopeptidase/D-esterase-like protein
VVLGPFRGAVEVRGLATGTRELDVLSPFHLVEGVDAILLSGGSAFGLAAAEGVMAWLEERGEGFDTGVAPVPLVPSAVIFDLATGKPRPGPREGREACEKASRSSVVEGRVGAGAGATIGKLLGPDSSAPGGVGSAARPWGEHWVGALVVVNALGDVLGPNGAVLAGVSDVEGTFVGTDTLLLDGALPGDFPGAEKSGSAWDGRGPRSGTNTTLAVVGTDLPLSRVDLGRVARVASGAFPRAISPVNTPFDGDVVFALSSGDPGAVAQPGQILSLGVLARDLVEEAIRRGVSTSARDGQ